MGHEVKGFYSCYSQGCVWRFLIGRLSPGLWTGASRNGSQSVDEKTSSVNKNLLFESRANEMANVAKKHICGPDFAT